MVKHNLNEELEVKGEVKSAFKLFEVIESGSNFDSYLQSMRFEAILESPTDAFKIKHIARRYATDSYQFECKFKKTFTATESDMLIKIDKNSSKDVIQVK